jgi:hypothetical protein
MYYIKALPPQSGVVNYNYSRYGVNIPNKETWYKNMKELFPTSPLTEDELFDSMRKDKRVEIKTQDEKNVIEADAKGELRKVIDADAVIPNDTIVIEDVKEDKTVIIEEPKEPVITLEQINDQIEEAQKLGDKDLIKKLQDQARVIARSRK